MPTRAACFDVMGTLFDLEPLRQRLRSVGAPAASLDIWFARLLHTATCLTLSNRFASFPEVAEATLRSALHEWGVKEERSAGVLADLSRLDPYPDAPAALELLFGEGVTVMALTNGSADNTRELLRRARLDRFVTHVVAAEEVRAYKPDRRCYERAAATLGACWPLPVDQPRAARDLQEAAAMFLSAS